jgi:hypothetical protein
MVAAVRVVEATAVRVVAMVVDRVVMAAEAVSEHVTWRAFWY